MRNDPMARPWKAASRRWLAIAGFCLASLCAHASENSQTWEGTIGKLPVVVRLDPSGGAFDDQYFYRKHRRGIDLNAARGDDGSLRLEERRPSWGAPDSVWTLAPPSEDGRLRGEWRQGERTLPIALRRVDPAQLPASDDPGLNAMRQDDPYGFLRFVDVKFEAGKEETVGAFRLQWWREPESDIALFRVLSGYPDAQLADANRALARRHWREVAASLDCRGAEMSDYTVATTLRYIGRDALSVSLHADYFCGGAHPDFGDNPFNYDPRTGHELALEDVLWLGEGAPPDRERDNDAWMTYRNEVFAPWVVERMSALYPDEVVPAMSSDDANAGARDEDDPGCIYDSPDLWNYASWHLRPEGVYLGASFARVGRVCDDPPWSVLPWDEVRKHAGAVKIEP
ncbi:MAG: hypothetical protein IT473_15925 [Lysobacter sp.]|nr:hypothetical protein [Lysobacter sp.]